MSAGAIVGIVLACFVLIVSIIFVVLYLVYPIKHFIKAKYAGFPVSLSDLMKVKLSGEDISLVVGAYIFANQNNQHISLLEVLAHHQIGGNIQTVTKAVKMAAESGIDISFAQAKAIDASGQSVIEAIKTCLSPKIVSTSEVVAVAGDGIEVKAKIDITLKCNIRRFVGGANESTIISRVEEAASSAISCAKTHKDVIENLDAITNQIESKNLDADCRYQVLSIEIVGAAVGSNVGLKLQTEKNEAALKEKITQAELKKKELEVKEQEAKVRLQEENIKTAQKEAEVPKAFIEALNKGKISAMDYLEIENLKSDTKMRNAITQNSLKMQSDFE